MTTHLAASKGMVLPCPSPESESKLKLNQPVPTGKNVVPIISAGHLVKDIHSETNLLAAPPIAAEPRKTIFDAFANFLSFNPALQKAFLTYGNDKKLSEIDQNGIKTKISLFSNQLSVFSNLVSLILPNSKALEGVNKIVDVVGQYTYRAMIGISAFAKFTKVSKNNDLIASVMSFVKTIFAFNAQNILALPLKMLGIKANLNLSFKNFYSWLGFTNGPMNISSAAANAMMSKQGFKTPGESLSVFGEQITDTIKAFKEKGFKALDPRTGVGTHGTLGGTLQLAGFLMKQTGLIMKDKHPGLGSALARSGGMLRNNVACWLTDIERFSLGNMRAGKIESVASGTNYSIEGILDELQQEEGINNKLGKQIRALMGLFGTWAAATNAEAVHEERNDFEGKSLIKGDVNLASFAKGMIEATIKANIGHSIPKGMADKLLKHDMPAANDPSIQQAPAAVNSEPLAEDLKKAA